MKLALTIFRKDTRRFWPLLLVWGAVLTIGISITAGIISIPPNSYGVGQLNLAISFIQMIECLVFGILVVAFVHEDALVGDRQFWMSRPIGPGSLVTAKLLDVTVWLLLPSGAAYALGARWLHADLSQFLSGVAPWLIFIGTFAAVLLAFAAITSNVVQLAFSLGGVFLIILGLGLSQYFYSLGAWLKIEHQWSTELTMMWSMAGLFGIGSLLIQAFRRRRGQTIVLMCAGLVVIPLSPALWPFGEVGIPSDPPTPISQISFQGAETRQVPHLINGVAHSDVAVTLRAVGGAQDRELALWPIKVTFQTASGAYHWKPDHGFQSGDPEADAKAELGWGPFPAQTLVIWPDTQPELKSYAGRIGRLESSIDVSEYHLVNIAEIPFREGSETRQRGFYLRLMHERGDIYMSGTKFHKRVVISFEFHAINGWNHSIKTFLINRARHEIASTGDLYDESGDLSASYDWAKIRGLNSSFGFDPKWNTQYGVSPETDTDEWVAGASLLLMDAVSLGDSKKALMIDGFKMPWGAAIK